MKSLQYYFSKEERSWKTLITMEGYSAKKMPLTGGWTIVDLPDTNATKIIDLMLEFHRQKAKVYAEFDWSKARIIWGPPSIDRKLLRTQKPILDVLTDGVGGYIVAALMPSAMNPYNDVPKEAIEKLRVIVGSDSTSQ